MKEINKNKCQFIAANGFCTLLNNYINCETCKLTLKVANMKESKTETPDETKYSLNLFNYEPTYNKNKLPNHFDKNH